MTRRKHSLWVLVAGGLPLLFMWLGVQVWLVRRVR